MIHQIVEGPGLIDYDDFMEWRSQFRYSKLSCLTMVARLDMIKMINTTTNKFKKYSEAVQSFKNPSSPQCVKLHTEYMELREHCEQMMTWAIISGEYQEK